MDEAVAISKVVQFLRNPAYSHFTRIIFDTAPTGHTLRLLTLPDFLDATVGPFLLPWTKVASALDDVPCFLVLHLSSFSFFLLFVDLFGWLLFGFSPF